MSDTNKPDFPTLNPGSPISPFSSTSSTSSGSGSGQPETLLHFPSTSKTNQSSVDSPPSSSGQTRTHPGRTSGNIYHPTLKTGMMKTQTTKSDVLSFGTCNYGHGSIMRAAGSSVNESHVSHTSKRLLKDGENLKKLGNENYKKGNFLKALSYYDQAIAISPDNAAYRSNRAAALIGLKRLNEAVKECYEAIKLDSGFLRAHHRLGSILVSLGQVENAKRHVCVPGYQPDPDELNKLQLVEKHLSKCTDCRRVRDWAGVLRECDAAMASGADSCPQLFACKAEALLKLRRLDDADVSMSSVLKFEESYILSCSQTKFFGMDLEAYLLFVRAQIDMAMGRFENAVTSIEKSVEIEPRNVEVAVLFQNIKSVCRARARGNDLFKSERFTEACSAYGEGLRLDPSNPVLYCNRAACWIKLGQLERSLDDCNQALLIHTNYTKALLRRAATYSKLKRWAESVNDYTILRRELPNNNDIAESLFHAQVALKKSRGEKVYNMKYGGEVELINSLEQFKSTVASTGASVVLFKSSSHTQCKQIFLFLDTLCARYPSLVFLKVDVEESPLIAKAENVSIIPTIKIYKKGNRVKEMICPSQEALESSVKEYTS